MRVAREQRLCRDDHAVEAIAALCALLGDEGLLHRIGMLACAQAFERHDVAPDAALDRNRAGPRGDAVDQHGARAAFTEPAAIFRSVQLEIVAQHVQQGGVGSGFDIMSPAIDGQAHRGGAPLNPTAKITFVYKRASRACRTAARCPIYEQGSEANASLCGSRDFSPRTPLDRFPTRAQDCSYTNDMPGG